MIRSRVCLLSLAAALLVAGPALAYSWPVFLALPAVFGQEAPPVEQTNRDMPYADQLPSHCCDELRSELLDDCLTTWQKLWQQGRFREALHLAQCAAQAAPDSIDAQHALIVSQIVNQLSAPAPGAIFLPSNFQSGIRPAGTLTPDLNLPVDTAFDVEFVRPEQQCPIMRMLETAFGNCKACKSCCDKCCAQCSDGTGCCKESGDCCKHGHAQSGCCPLQAMCGQQGPVMIWILREPTASMMPTMVPPPTTAYGPMMPPNFAPPPPPFIAQDGSAYIPVPVPMMPQRVQPAHFDQEEMCEMPVPPPMPCMPAMPADVRITQHGNRVHLSCAHYDADCERLHGAGQGGFVLEGNVILVSRRHGQTMTINAQRVTLNPKEDHFVVEQAQGMEQSRMNVAPVGYSMPR